MAQTDPKNERSEDPGKNEQHKDNRDLNQTQPELQQKNSDRTKKNSHQCDEKGSLQNDIFSEERTLEVIKKSANRT